MKISDFLPSSQIKLQLKSRSKDDLFPELIHVLSKAGRLPDRTAALRAIQAREERMCTGVNHGLAIPHANLPDLPGLVIAMGVSEAGIDYGSPDGQPVHTIFLVLSRSGDPAQNIHCLAEICRLFSHGHLLARIREARTAEDVLDLIRREE